MALRINEFNPIFSALNSANSPATSINEPSSIFQQLNQDIDRLDKQTTPTNQTQKAVLYALSPLPPARRIGSLPDSIEENNYPRAGLLLGLAAANFPGDLREMGLAFREGKNIFAKGLTELAKNEHQHAFSFFKGTLFEPLVHKFPWLKKLDNTLFDTKFGEFLQQKLSLNIDFTDIRELKAVGSDTPLKSYRFEGKALQKIAGRSLFRIPVIGLAASALLETPAIIKSVTKTEGNIVDKAKALGKQLIKSAGYIGLSTAGIAIVGAAFASYGAIASLVGMAIGSTVALIASNAFNKQFDKLC